jgi:hypothetical protein
VVGPPTDELGADAAPLVQVIRLAEQREVKVARACDRPRVGLLQPGCEPQERGLPVAVAADDPDPVAGLDAERDVVQDAAGPVALRDRIEVDQVAGDRPILCWAS